LGFWSELARRELVWQTPFTQTLDDSDAPNYRWFADGRLNVSYNCLDVHLAERGHQTALIFEGEPGDSRCLSYRELHVEVCRCANALKDQGVRLGDRVVIYMPLVPEIVVAMHACARIGAIHSVVFGGFSATSLKDRIEDAGAKLLITADGGWRGGRAIELKAAVDQALAAGCRTIERVIVYRRTGEPVSMDAKRDVWWHEVVEGRRPSARPNRSARSTRCFFFIPQGQRVSSKGFSTRAQAISSVRSSRCNGYLICAPTQRIPRTIPIRTSIWCGTRHRHAVGSHAATARRCDQPAAMRRKLKLICTSSPTHSVDFQSP
jgi:acetyl-CoA synthetase